jgi:cobalt-zinc-cadmium resistance protein CzcA
MVESAIVRLRPILMTTLVATLGLVPAGMSHGIGSHSQRSFAIVIVGGLMVSMLINLVLLPTVDVWVVGDGDLLPAPDGEFDETES